jgi:DNA helicase HerA-like ATPase
MDRHGMPPSNNLETQRQKESQSLKDMEDLLYVNNIPRKAWQEVKFDIYNRWTPKDSPHHSIISLSGGGKSYLATRGLLPMRGWRRNLIIDVKGDDDTLKEVGRAVRELPRKDPTFRRRREPDSLWYRLVVSDDWAKAREQVKSALTQVYRQGNWTVFLDETRNLTDPRVPSLNLRNYVEQIWLRGRSRGVELVSMTQAPRWVPSSFYDQPSFVWIGRINDERAHQRLREIGGLRRSHLPLIAALEKREFLVVGDGGDYTAITKVPDLATQSEL